MSVIFPRNCMVHILSTGWLLGWMAWQEFVRSTHPKLDFIKHCRAVEYDMPYRTINNGVSAAATGVGESDRDTQQPGLRDSLADVLGRLDTSSSATSSPATSTNVAAAAEEDLDDADRDSSSAPRCRGLDHPPGLLVMIAHACILHLHMNLTRRCNSLLSNSLPFSHAALLLVASC